MRTFLISTSNLPITETVLYDDSSLDNKSNTLTLNARFDPSLNW